MDHADLENAVKGLNKSIGGIRDDLRSKFSTIDERFSLIHADLKKLQDLLVNVAQFDTWKTQHEKITDTMQRRIDHLEGRIREEELSQTQVHSRAVMNERLIWFVITAVVGGIGIWIGNSF